ncbi:hypothetical protein U1Q18_023234, partial [Sarracenia purpurea var. burkii]
MGTKVQRNTSKNFNVLNRELSISSSLAKNSDRIIKNHHEQSELPRSEGLLVKPSSGLPELQSTPLADKKVNCSSDGKLNSSVSWRIGEKSKEDQSSSEDQPSQIPEGFFQKSSNQDRSRESGNSDQAFLSRSLRTRFEDCDCQSKAYQNQFKRAGQSGSSALNHKGCYGLDAHHETEMGKIKIPYFLAENSVQPTEGAQLMEVDQDCGENCCNNQGISYKPCSLNQSIQIHGDLECDIESKEKYSEIEPLLVGDLIPCKPRLAVHQKSLTHATNLVFISLINFSQSMVTNLDDPNLGGIDLAERILEREPLPFENPIPRMPLSPVHRKSPTNATNSVIISSTIYPQSLVTNVVDPSPGGSDETKKLKTLGDTTTDDIEA